MSISEIAVFAAILFMAFAALGAIAGRRGYAFDLRRGPRRKDAHRSGGRRASDGLSA